jgi:twitching motility protein PilT
MDRNAFHKLLAFGIERGVSDIHFEVGYPPHYRLHGELLGAIKVPGLTAADTEGIARMILEDRSITVDFTRRFAEIDVSYSLAQRGRFRASIFRQRGSVGIVMRLIPITILSIEQLNLPPVLAEIADARRGLVLITGATGNGKTTTMAAMLRYINETRHAHIVTIEDPIEYIHEPQKCMIIQREVGADTESFRDAMTAAMRQDPDVILVGEIRDRETAATALKAAETGHLVVSAIHTPDAVATIQRYVGLFETDSQDVIRDRLGDCLQAVVSLRLVASKDGRRRLPAVEILRVTRTIRECIRSARLSEIPELIRKGRDLYSMQLFDQHLIDLVNAGLVNMETAIYASSNPEEFERALRVD